MVTNYAETVSLCVRPDMDTPYRAHVEGIFVTGRCEEALTQATSNPWAAGSIPARRAISNSYMAGIMINAAGVNSQPRSYSCAKFDACVCPISVAYLNCDFAVRSLRR
jgi:hypothetical protein